MRAFAHLPSKRRVAGAIAFALMILSALGAVHHHRIAVPATEAAFSVPTHVESARTADCAVCRTVVSSGELVPVLFAPHASIERSAAAPATIPVRADVFGPSAPRAPPAA